MQKTPEISTVCYGQSSVIVADLDGNAHLIAAPDFTVTLSWHAYDRGRVTHASFAQNNRGILVTIGEDESSAFPVLKVWSLVGPSRKSAARFRPRLLICGNLQSTAGTGGTAVPYPVSAVALSPTLSHVAVGLADGSILLYRHLDNIIAASASSTSTASLPKPRPLSQPTQEPITGLHFAHFATAKADSVVKAEGTLYATTTTKAFSYHASGKGAPSVVDDIGAAVDCSLVVPASQKLVIARDEAIYVYGREGREACIALDGPKSALRSYEHFLVIVSPPFHASAASGSATVRKYVAQNRDASGDIARIGIFDLKHKIIAHSSAFEQGVRDVFVQWGKIWAVANDGKLTKMEPVPLSSQLDALYSKSLFLLALEIAQDNGCNEKELATIHRRYAEHLYDTNHFDAAMSQFLQTVGYTEPSHVIRKVCCSPVPL